MSRRSMRAALGAFALVCATCACSSSSSSSSSSGGDAGASGNDGGPQREPKAHRATAVACTSDRPAGQAMTPAPTGSACSKDADCTSGKNGRCWGSLAIGGNACSYDQCAADAECGSASACDCRVRAQSDANVCLQGNCKIDGDCGAGAYCSASAVDIDVTCRTGLAPGSIGMFCHAAGDECVDDADCTSTQAHGEPHCIFSVDARHWVCFYARCTG